MIEINIFLLLGITAIISIASTLLTSYLKKIGESVGIMQMQGKLTEIDEKIKHGFAKNQITESEQRTILLNFHTECMNVLFDSIEIHKETWFNNRQLDLSKWENQNLKLNKSLSSIKLFFIDQIIVDKTSVLYEALKKLIINRWDYYNRSYLLIGEKGD